MSFSGVGHRRLQRIVLLALAALAVLVPAAGGARAIVPPAVAATIHHIQIVTDLESLPAEYWHSAYASDTNPLIESLVEPTAGPLARLRTAIDRLPPLLRGSISKISIANYTGGGAAGDSTVVGDTYGNNMILSTVQLANQTNLNNTVAHEAVHCFQGLVDLAQNTDTSNIPADTLTKVNSAQGKLRNSTTAQVLRRLQNSAKIADSVYREYAGDAWSSTYSSVGDAVISGFAAPYGAEGPREDLAELGSIFTGSDFANHAYCVQFEGYDKEIPDQRALAIAKLNLLRALGLIDEGQYGQCVRNADPVDAQLISMGSREFAGDLGHGTQTVSHEDLDHDWVMWRIRGEASDAKLEIRLRIRRRDAPSVGSPIGFYALDTVGKYGMAADTLTPIAAQSVLTFQRSDTSNDTEFAAYARISGGGYVLITDFNDDMVKGYAFNVPFYSIIEIEADATDEMDLIWFLWER